MRIDLPAPVPALRFERQEVEHAERAGWRPEAGLEHERPLQIAPLGLRGPLDRKPERAAAVAVQQAGEHAWGVEARSAQPFDRTVRCCKRGRVRVREECVALDRRIATGASAAMRPVRHSARTTPRARARRTSRPCAVRADGRPCRAIRSSSGAAPASSARMVSRSSRDSRRIRIRGRRSIPALHPRAPSPPGQAAASVSASSPRTRSSAALGCAPTACAAGTPSR